VANELVEIVNDRVRLHLHPGQTKAWDSQRRFIFVIAGTQGGKTSFGPWWLHRETQRCGDGDYLAVTASYDLFKLKLLPEMKRVFQDLLGWKYYASDRLMALGDKRLILRSASAEGGLESATALAALLDECGQDEFRLESWEAVQRRLSLSQGRVLGTTTPYNLGWLKTEVFDRWRAGDPDFEIVQFKNIQNPRFPRAEYDRMKGKLPAWKFKMFYDGEFSRPAGMIYADYDEAIHRIPARHIPNHWPHYVGIDFGAVNTAMIWIAEDPEKHVYYLYREYHAGDKTTQGHAYAYFTESGMHQEDGEWVGGESIVYVTGGAKSEKQQRWDWNAAGVPVSESPIIDVEAGIDRVIELLKTKRLFIFDTCRGVLDEIGTYARELDDSGQPTEKIKDKETFHRLDALRYCVSSLDFGSGLIAW
jgi:hypothetical protein